MSAFLQITHNFVHSIIDITDTSAQKLPAEVRNIIQKDLNSTKAHALLSDYIFIISLMIGAGAFLYFLSTLKDKVRFKIAERDRLQLLQQRENVFVYHGNKLNLNQEEIKEILQHRFPYYSSLNSQLQAVFIKRVTGFINDKVFIMMTADVFKEMPVLISASAVQLTLGLRRYMMRHFRYIQIHKQEYNAPGNARKILAGHVYKHTITVAWKQFYNGVHITGDGSNVGLHEMAHALYVQHVLFRKMYEPDEFASSFKILEEIANNCFERSVCGYKFYAANAFKNKQEFWADSIELFFERSIEMQRYYPKIYKQLRILLKQDPVYKENPVHYINP